MPSFSLILWANPEEPARISFSAAKAATRFTGSQLVNSVAGIARAGNSPAKLVGCPAYATVASSGHNSRLGAGRQDILIIFRARSSPPPISGRPVRFRRHVPTLAVHPLSSASCCAALRRIYDRGVP